jgi:hypothetical protein
LAAQLFQQSAQDKIGELEKLRRKKEEEARREKKLTAGIVIELNETYSLRLERPDLNADR